MRPKKKKGIGDNNPANIKLIAEISELPSASERSAALRWYEQQSEMNRLKIHQEQSKIIRNKHTSGGPITPELTYGSLLCAIKIARRNEESLSMKRAVSVAEANEIAAQRMDGFKREKKLRGAEKATKIRVQYFGLICTLKEQKDFSWSEVASYLFRYHNFDVTKAYLQQQYNLLKKEAADVEKLQE